MVAGGGDHDQQAVGREHPGELRAVARREDIQQYRGRAVGHRQPEPGVGEHRTDARMGAGRPAQRRLGHVDRQPDRVGVRVEHRRQVVPDPRAHVDDQPGDRRRRGGERRRDEVVVPGGQEVGARVYHPGAVAGVRDRVGGQVHIALLRPVEAVPARAAHRGVEAGQFEPAHRAAQERQYVGEHDASPHKVSPWSHPPMTKS